MNQLRRVLTSMRYLRFVFVVIQLTVSEGDCLVISDTTIRQNDSTILLCDYEGAAMTWRYYTNVFDNVGDVVSRGIFVESRFQGRFFVLYNSTVYGIAILQVRESDTGIYKCAYESRHISSTVLHVLPVWSPNCSVWSQDLVQGPLQIGKESQNIILACESGVKNNYPLIRWFKEGNETELASENQRNDLRIETTLKPEDKDIRYTCVIGTGDVASLPSCSVIPFPSKPNANITPLTARRMLGENVTFTCTGSVKNGDVRITWDDKTLLQFQGRHVLNQTELVITNLKATDNNTTLVCIVQASTGAEESVKATLLVETNSKRDGTGDRNIQKDENFKTTGGLGAMAGIIVAACLALLVVIIVIFVLIKRRNVFHKNDPSDHEKPGSVTDYDDASKQNADRQVDALEYAETVRYQKHDETLNNKQVTYDQVHKDVEIDNNEGNGVTSNYEQMKPSKENLKHHISENQASNHNEDNILPVYAEVKKGSKSEFEGHRQSQYAYTVVDKKHRKSKTKDQLNSSITDTRPDYPKVREITMTENHVIDDDVYASPDLLDDGRDKKEITKYEKVNKEIQINDKMSEQVYAEPDMNVVLSEGKGREFFAQSIHGENIIESKEGNDGYAKPQFEETDTNDQNRRNVTELEEGEIFERGVKSNGMARYEDVDPTRNRENSAGYAKPDFNLSGDGDMIDAKGAPASPLYAEVQQRDSDDNRNTPKQLELTKPKYAKVNKKPKKQVEVDAEIVFTDVK